MRFEQAKKLQQEKQSLIGTIDEKGFRIDGFIIVPSNNDSQVSFFQAYMFSNNAEASILPFVNEEVELWAIDTKHLKEAGVLFYDKIEE